MVRGSVVSDLVEYEYKLSKQAGSPSVGAGHNNLSGDWDELILPYVHR